MSDIKLNKNGAPNQEAPFLYFNRYAKLFKDVENPVIRTEEDILAD